MATLQAPLRTQKKALRKAMEVTLRTLPPAVIQSHSQKVYERVISSPFFHQSKTVSCYLSMPKGEVDTSELALEVLRAGKTLLVPKIVGNDMEFLKVYGKDDLQSLPHGTWGIKEPDLGWDGHTRLNVKDEGCPPLDLILTPGVAFDRSFSRLGHGKGFYDKFLTSYVALGRKRPLLVALALQEQILDAGDVPVGDHDWKVDAIVSPEGVTMRNA